MCQIQRLLLRIFLLSIEISCDKKYAFVYIWCFFAFIRFVDSLISIEARKNVDRRFVQRRKRKELQNFFSFRLLYHFAKILLSVWDEKESWGGSNEITNDTWVTTLPDGGFTPKGQIRMRVGLLFLFSRVEKAMWSISAHVPWLSTWNTFVRSYRLMIIKDEKENVALDVSAVKSRGHDDFHLLGILQDITWRGANDRRCEQHLPTKFTTVL